ncbi:hypothetical protein B0T10DRAFT_213818 [Thelonectria olida]|uniref:Phosphoglycerate mutase n=1 Tax=Thelonectria olida TaxID=1576542 RepID=A0A9P8WE58_9HYPO|nr:hypothetical protein B0T10DRAFT_213818 [Thelonectria olida]
MGGTPAYVFVVRHGNRLDAADKRWHLSSPTPYDPPLTYNGFLQARMVGNQIASILEQAKIDSEANGTKKRKRFKVVIHSSPFLRCVQTSIGISSALAQTSAESPNHPSDVCVSATGSAKEFKPVILRLDSFLGEWLSPEYFEQITPPPGAALMVGSAKADLLRRVDYSTLTNPPPISHSHTSSSGSLWNGSPSASPSIHAQQMPSPPPSEKDTWSVGSAPASSMAAALSGQLGAHVDQAKGDQKKGYAFPKPHYAISSSGKIPEGLTAHARDHCMVVDYQWDSMRSPLDFGDGGQFGEEWHAMHKRFRKGLKKLVHWYATTEAPTETVTKGLFHHDEHANSDDEDVETVVIMVSHGAGCNALIGAITHQPVLMDVGIASITMAVRKPDVTYPSLLAASRLRDPASDPYVSPHELFDIRLSATTDHLRSTTSTPVSTRSSTNADMFPAGAGTRGRAPSIGNATGAVMGSFVYTSEPLLANGIANGSRSTSANAVMGSSIRRNSASQRPTPKAAAFGTVATTGATGPRSNSPRVSSPSFGLWSPAPSSLRLVDDGAGDDIDEEDDDFDSLLPNFDGSRFKTGHQKNKTKNASIAPVLSSKEPNVPFQDFSMAQSISLPILSIELPSPALPTLGGFAYPSFGGDSTPKSKPRGPILSAPIRIRTNVEFEKPVEEINFGSFGDGLGGTWGLPVPPGEAERLRDMSLSKRRWTTTERA